MALPRSTDPSATQILQKHPPDKFQRGRHFHYGDDIEGYASPFDIEFWWCMMLTHGPQF